MYTIYYYNQSSGSIKTAATVQNECCEQQTQLIASYYDISLEISASADPITGSENASNELRYLLRTGSYVIATFPLTTNVIYKEFDDIFQQTLAPNDATQSLNTITLTYYFNQEPPQTSSLDKLILYSGSTIILSASQSPVIGSIFLTEGVTYTAVVSGSGDFYTASLQLDNTTTSTQLLYETSSNSNITVNFTASSNNSYTLTATTAELSYIKLTYDTTGDIPLPTSSISPWNQYLQASASAIYVTQSSVYMLGGELSTQALINISGSKLNSIRTKNLSNLLFYNLETDSLNKLPNIEDNPQLEYLRVGTVVTGDLTATTTATNLQTLIANNNLLSGSLSPINALNNYYLSYFDCSNNNITGSTSDLSRAYSLQSYDVSSNQLSGSILSLDGIYKLEYFDCSSNHLTGSIPSLTSGILLRHFDVNNNKLTGNIPNLASSSLLSYLDISFNNCSGDIPSLSNNTQLTYVDLYQNQLSGSIPDLSNLTLLEFFDCGRNNLTGSIPNLDNNVLLQQFSCQDNDLSGSIPSLTNNTALFAFDASDNYLTGSIPYLGNTSLQVISVANNQLTGYVSGSVPSSLTVFLAQINQLSQPAVDGILEDLDNAGATGPSAFALLNGGTNSTPSATGLTYKANLQAKGWTVLTN